jgi:hypothetical protein
MTVDHKAVEARIAELRSDVRRAEASDRAGIACLRDSLASTADMLEGLVREVDEIEQQRESLSEEHSQLRRNYLDLADALLPTSTGTDQLMVEARRLRAEVARLTAENERLRTALPACAHCDQGSAACFGQYDSEGDGAAACDVCCGHGNEDGWCVPLTDLPGWVETVSLNARIIAKERDRMRAVVEAADAWRDCPTNDMGRGLVDAVDAYRASKEPT